MAEQQENQIQGALKDMGKNILMKHSLVQTMEVEYKSICKKTENNLKELEEFTTNIYNLEDKAECPGVKLITKNTHTEFEEKINHFCILVDTSRMKVPELWCSANYVYKHGYLSASNCRLEKYCEKEAEWKNENLSLKQSVDDAKKSLDEAKKIAYLDDTEFDQNVIKLVEGLQKERSLHDPNTTKESLHKLELMDKALAQETIVVKNMIEEQHIKYPFKESEEVSFILKNTDICDSINLEINKMLMRKNEFLNRLDELKEKVRQLEEEIKILNKRA